MKKEAVVLFSGGIDSTTCLALAVEAHGAANVMALTMFYGQKHNKELESAKAIAEHYGVTHVVRDLSTVFTFEENNPLLGQAEMPTGTYKEQLEEKGIAPTYVPFRNGLFLSYAAAIAYSVDASVVVYGAHSDDAAGNAYPDCSMEFYDAFGKGIFVGTGNKVLVKAPLIDLNKGDVVALGIRHDAPYELSWSCYEGGEVACGVCSTCIDRLEAFAQNNILDPITYAGDIL
jgi:7-cyano-7-deazaguanine synthase